MPGVIQLTCMGIDPGVLHWTLGSGASACHAEPIPLFAMKLARALAGRPIRALLGVIHLARFLESFTWLGGKEIA